jgi:hypothetical protein
LYAGNRGRIAWTFLARGLETLSPVRWHRRARWQLLSDWSITEIRWKAPIGKPIVLGFVHQGGEPRQFGPQLIGDRLHALFQERQSDCDLLWRQIGSGDILTAPQNLWAGGMLTLN